MKTASLSTWPSERRRVARERRGEFIVQTPTNAPRRPLDPRHVRRHVTTLPGDLRRRLFCMPRARAHGPRRDLLRRRDDLRQRPGRRRRRRDRGLRGHGLRRPRHGHRGPARSVGRLYNRTTPAPVRRPGPRRGPGPGPAGADPDLGVGHLPARRPRGRLRATRCSTNQRPPGHFWSATASSSLLRYAFASILGITHPSPSTPSKRESDAIATRRRGLRVDAVAARERDGRRRRRHSVTQAARPATTTALSARACCPEPTPT